MVLVELGLGLELELELLPPVVAPIAPSVEEKMMKKSF